MLPKLNILEVATKFGTLVSIMLAFYVDALTFHISKISQTSVSSNLQAATAMFVLINLGIVAVHIGMCMKPAFVTACERSGSNV